MNHTVFKSLIRNTGKAEIKLVGGSMAPLLQPDDLVRVTEQKKMIIGRLYLIYTEPGQLVLHRLVGIERSRALFKGDHAKCTDALDCNHVLGEASAIKLKGLNAWVTVEDFRVNCVCAQLSREIGALFEKRGAAYTFRRKQLCHILDSVNYARRRVWELSAACFDALPKENGGNNDSYNTKN